MAELQAPYSDIAIVGGGIAGLALAAALGDSGLSVAVLEARDLPEGPANAGSDVADFDRRVSALTPRSIAFLDRLDAWAGIDAGRHCAYRHMTVWDAEGTGTVEFDAAEVGAGSLGSIVENRLIRGALAARVRAQGRAQLVEQARLAAVRPAGEGSLLELDDGRCYQCGLLIGADGALSGTRELLGFRTREWDYGHRAIVTTARFERGHEFTAWQRFLPTGPLALLPLTGNDGGDRLCSIVWSITEAQAEPLLALDDSGFNDALTQASEARLGDVLACAPRQAFPLRQRHAVDYVQEGVALVGDAAHTIHPLAGQGINLGLADVDELAGELLRAEARGLAPGRIEVLRRYQRKRKADNLTMMAAMEGFKRLFEQESPPLRWLRNRGMRAVDGLPAVKRRIIREAMGVS